ncbi:hypothetical protein NARC_160028 [Candidatus Nitrosocosmicus arcticus]|uniref:Uncharacterized protein n=1 Tax=Candidatus Nitrosocosmicus arcticus TaxID=2035267 RepID=A0A557SRT9_9ARCH|nr:hypothetical protein NARC_160028 [Candidatus Nitrosocosmicus arcticus]
MVRIKIENAYLWQLIIVETSEPLYHEGLNPTKLTTYFSNYIMK